MAKFEIKYPHGATPLTPDEREGLIPDYITTQGELNELEQDNIQSATLWAQKKKSLDILESSFVSELHRQMFNQVWRWAGRLRNSGKNIGVDWHLISGLLGQLLTDTKYWIENQTYPWDETAIRFHHRLVHIHAFPNGNGRHARLMTDLLLETNGQTTFSWGMKWGGTPLEVESDRRHEYIAALKAADQNRYDLLLKFVRS